MLAYSFLQRHSLYLSLSLFLLASNLEELVKLGVAFRDLAGPVFMDLVQELRNLGKQLNCRQKFQISQFIQSSSIDTS